MYNVLNVLSITYYKLTKEMRCRFSLSCSQRLDHGAVAICGGGGAARGGRLVSQTTTKPATGQKGLRTKADNAHNTSGTSFTRDRR